MAPYFAIGMVFFLMLFVAYFVLAVVAIAVDFGAMDVECAEVSGNSVSTSARTDSRRQMHARVVGGDGGGD